MNSSPIPTFKLKVNLQVRIVQRHLDNSSQPAIDTDYKGLAFNWALIGVD